MRTVKVQSEQNIIDIVIQEMGSAEGLFDVLELNDGLGVNSILVRGQIINLPDAPTDQNNLDFYLRNDLTVLTGEQDIFGDFNDDFNDDFNN